MSEVKLSDWARNRAREILKRRAIEARESALYQLTHAADYDTSKLHPQFQEAASPLIVVGETDLKITHPEHAPHMWRAGIPLMLGRQTDTLTNQAVWD